MKCIWSPPLSLSSHFLCNSKVMAAASANPFRILIGVCFVVLLQGLASAQPFDLHGFVYCDTCRCGFETNASIPISGAIVRLECRDRAKWVLTFTKKAITSSEGTYTISVAEDHKDESCKVVLVSSPHPTCYEPDPGRSSATVILTNNNGLTNNLRHANAMGFLIRRPLALCSSLLKQYLDYDESM